MNPVRPSPSFLEELAIQRWDDHRYYHQSRINQALHLFSALCFLATYVLIPFEPAIAAILGWVVAMWSRQIGHFFFEPTGYDHVNDASFAHKEAIKVGFNLRRKVVLLVAWVAVPVLLWWAQSNGFLPPASEASTFVDRVGYTWLSLAAVGLLGRTAFLMATRNVQTGLVWLTKILTDPVNDVRTYYKAPYYLWKGQLLDPMEHVSPHTAA